ncbi:hypothetical protein EHO65_16820 [Leptospira andrefontaineae]|uniref:Uncharacterized protein n=1 Tax=Leptospira andrefontaineae TaxID=2484976 RepID=A0A4R9GZV2_9LEPT|nr:hypothetical protein EHO65_16820 [Leptospira andrefontaineae]
MLGAILLPNYRCFRSARSSLARLTRSGYATFASVTSFAKQTRAIANVGTPWSLGAISRFCIFEFSKCKSFPKTIVKFDFRSDRFSPFSYLI